MEGLLLLLVELCLNLYMYVYSDQRVWFDRLYMHSAFINIFLRGGEQKRKSSTTISDEKICCSYMMKIKTDISRK